MGGSGQWPSRRVGCGQDVVYQRFEVDAIGKLSVVDGGVDELAKHLGRAFLGPRSNRMNTLTVLSR